MGKAMSTERDIAAALGAIDQTLLKVEQDIAELAATSEMAATEYAKTRQSVGELHSKLDFVIERIDKWMDSTGETVGKLRRELNDLKAARA